MPGSNLEARLVRGNLLKAIRKFQAAGESVYRYNGNHPKFPLNLLPNPMRQQLKAILARMEFNTQASLADV